MSGCPNCSKCDQLVNKIIRNYPELEIEVIDVIEHPEIVQKYAMLSPPGIVIDGKLEFTGFPKEDELRKKIRKF